MKFTHQTLSSTAHRFSTTLKHKGLELSWEKAQNLWAQIAVGKDYSAAVSQANANGALQAIQITDKSIKSILQSKSRQIDLRTAEAIFTETVGPDVAELSPGVGKLIDLVKSSPDACVMWVGGDRARMGLIEARYAGYLPVSQLGGIGLTDDETTWLRGSAELMVVAINNLSGKGSEQTFSIFAANHRAGSQKSDDEFRRHFTENLEATCAKIAQDILQAFVPEESPDWDFDFDSIRSLIEYVFERACDRKGSWLKFDCDLANATIDHLAVRIRESLKWMADQASCGEPDEDPTDTIAYAARFAMKKILQVRE